MLPLPQLRPRSRRNARRTSSGRAASCWAWSWRRPPPGPPAAGEAGRCVPSTTTTAVALPAARARQPDPPPAKRPAALPRSSSAAHMVALRHRDAPPAGVGRVRAPSPVHHRSARRPCRRCLLSRRGAAPAASPSAPRSQTSRCGPPDRTPFGAPSEANGASGPPGRHRCRSSLSSVWGLLHEHRTGRTRRSAVADRVCGGAEACCGVVVIRTVRIPAAAGPDGRTDEQAPGGRSRRLLLRQGGHRLPPQGHSVAAPGSREREREPGDDRHVRPANPTPAAGSRTTTALGGRGTCDGGRRDLRGLHRP